MTKKEQIQNFLSLLDSYIYNEIDRSKGDFFGEIRRGNEETMKLMQKSLEELFGENK